MKKILKKYRLKLKHFWHQSLLKHYDFSIISNNCWGTRTYKKYGLEYLSPFQSMFIFAPDYIDLITDFTIEKLEILNFIEHNNSKYKDELLKQNIYDTPYPIAILKDGTEVHFLHYKTNEDAKLKWDRRIKKINPNKLIFKFSDGNLSTTKLIEQFDALPYKNKICFTSRPYKNLKSIIYMDMFQNSDEVAFEWKYDSKYIDLYRFINLMK